MIKEPLISVLMPAYNAELYIKDAIESILSQSYKKFELLIYDDGSTDDTRKIIDKYSDERIVKVYADKNSGVVVARNTLIDRAQGAYIALMDADDIAHPMRLEKQIKYLLSNPVDLCGSSQWNLNQLTGRLKASKDSYLDADLRSLLVAYCSICNSTIMGRSEIFKKFKYSLSVPMAEDYYLWCQMAAADYKFANLKDRLLTYRQYPEQSSSKYAYEFQQSTSRIQKNYLDLLGIPIKFRPVYCSLKIRMYRAINLLIYLNKRFPGMTFLASTQIYSRFQLKNNRWCRPFQKIERFFIVGLVYIYFLLDSK